MSGKFTKSDLAFPSIFIDKLNKMGGNGYVYDTENQSFTEGKVELMRTEVEVRRLTQQEKEFILGLFGIEFNFICLNDAIVDGSVGDLYDDEEYESYLCSVTLSKYIRLNGIDVDVFNVDDEENMPVENETYNLYYEINNGAKNWRAHAEGSNTTTIADAAHTEGYSTMASGWYSHAEGENTSAVGDRSHAEGGNTTASGSKSHAEGYWTTAMNATEHAEGRFNVSHKGSESYGKSTNTQHSIGIGKNENARKNAFEIMQNGDMYLYGAGGYDGINTKKQNKNIKTVQELLKSGGGGGSLDYATDDEIDQIFGHGTQPTPPSEFLKYYLLKEGGYAPTPLEGFVNIDGETMEYDGDTYYKWTLYEQVGEDETAEKDYMDGVYILTNTLDITSNPFTTASPEFAYIFTVDEGEGSGTYKLEDDGSYGGLITVEENGEVKRVIPKLPKYESTILESLVNNTGETMTYNGQAYYKWVKYDDNGGGGSEPDMYGNKEPKSEIIVLTTSLEPELPFNVESPEFGYVLTFGEAVEYTSVFTSRYIKEAKMHRDGTITYDE